MADRPSGLLPCPCCRSPARLSKEYEDCDGNAAVECSVCNLLSWTVRDWNVRTLDAATVASGPMHDRHGIVSQLLDSASIASLPKWVRELMQKAADAIDAAPADPINPTETDSKLINDAPSEPVPSGDDRILWGVVANAGRLSRRRQPRWAHVSNATALGSTSSSALCRRFGFDPDELVPPKPAKEQSRGR